MKYIISFLCFVSLKAFGQSNNDTTLIKENMVGQLKKGGFEYCSVIEQIIERDTSYFLRYHNSDYQYINDFENLKLGSWINTIAFYNAVDKIFSMPTNEKLALTSLGENIIISTEKIMGKKYARIDSQKGSLLLSRKDLARLFNIPN